VVVGTGGATHYLQQPQSYQHRLKKTNLADFTKFVITNLKEKGTCLVHNVRGNFERFNLNVGWNLFQTI
jgi:hypothetical protein